MAILFISFVYLCERRLGYSIELKLCCMNKKLEIDEGEGNSHTKFSEISFI